MSHITKAQRQSIDLSPVGNCPLVNSRELSYAVSVLARGYMTGMRDKSRYDEVVGALERAKQMLYKEFILPFEEQQKFENGEIK